MMKLWIVLGLTILVLRIFFFSKPSLNLPSDPPFSVEITLNSEPKFGPNSQRISLDTIDIVLPRYPELGYGDRVKISVVKLACQQPDPSSAKVNTGRCSAVFPKVEILGNNQGNWLMTKVLVLRRQILDNFKNFLPQPEMGLVGGVVLGDKNGLQTDLKDSLRVAGLSHVAVASGMNIAFIVGFLTKFLKKRSLVVLTAIWFYALLAGFEAPVVRAATMASLMIAGEMAGRKSLGFWSLLITGWIMLVIEPGLLYDLGFQLSILATAGVMMIPKLETLGAILMTTPVIVNAFGAFSLIALPANVLLLWVIGPLTVLGMIMAVTGPLLTIPVYALAHFFIWGVEVIGSQKFWLLADLQIVPVVWAGYYLLILAVWLKIKS